MALERLNFDLLKGIPIEQLLHARGLLDAFTLRGNRIYGPCPVHRGDNPNAFVVTRSRNLWYCFSQCQSGGDVIDLLAALDGIDRIQAARTLAATAQPHYRPPVAQFSPSQRQSSRFRPFSNRLNLDHTAALLGRKAIRPSTARLFDAGAWRGNGWLAGCVAVRLHNPAGDPLGYAGRRLNYESKAPRGKWKMPPGLPKSNLLYAWHHARHNLRKPLVVVECPWAVMRLHQIGVPAVALLGTGLSATQYQLITTAPRIIVMLDGDAAGRVATGRIARQLASRRPVRTAHLPDGCDPDDLSEPHLAQILLHLFP
jgi:DNA primase